MQLNTKGTTTIRSTTISTATKRGHAWAKATECAVWTLSMWSRQLASCLAAEVRHDQVFHVCVRPSRYHPSHVVHVFHCYVDHAGETLQDTQPNDRWVPYWLIGYRLITNRSTVGITIYKCNTEVNTWEFIHNLMKFQLRIL